MGISGAVAAWAVEAGASAIVGDIIGGAVAGAVWGGGISAVTGGDVGQGMMMGALGGGIAGGVTGAAAAPSAATMDSAAQLAGYESAAAYEAAGGSMSGLTDVARQMTAAGTGSTASGLTVAQAGTAGKVAGALGANVLGSSLGVGSGIHAIQNPGMTSSAARLMADPWGGSRQTYVNQLNELMANPSLTRSQPGYQFGMREGMNQVNAGLAAKGQSMSGAAGMAQQQFGQNYAMSQFTDYYNKLAALSGANQSPSAGANAALSAQAQATAQSNFGWQAVMQGAGAGTLGSTGLLQSLYTGRGGSAPQQQAAPQGYGGGWESVTTPQQSYDAWNGGYYNDWSYA